MLGGVNWHSQLGMEIHPAGKGVKMKKNIFIVVLCAFIALFSVSCADEP